MTKRIDQCQAFANACCDKWGIPRAITKLVIECEVGQPIRVYFATFLLCLTNEDQSVLLENVKDVSVTDRCEVVAVPHSVPNETHSE
jgi:hypothetical protein